MRRRSSGLLLPGLVLTFVATFGVVVLFAVGSPVLPGQTGAIPVAGEDRRTNSVTVPSASPSPTATRQAPRRTTEPTTQGPTRGGTPTRTGSGAVPRTSAPPRATASAVPPAPRCAAGSATVTAVADAYVDQAQAQRNFGDDGLAVASRDKGRNRRSLVRFAFPAVPKGCTLRSATLTLVANDASGRRVLVSRAARSWSEGGVTWASAPSPSGTSVSATVSGRTVSWNVTGHVATMRAGSNFGFVLRDASESGKNVPQTTFADRSTPRRPALTLRWS